MASIFSGLLIVVIFYYHNFMGNGYCGSNAGGEGFYDTAFSSYGLIRYLKCQ